MDPTSMAHLSKYEMIQLARSYMYGRGAEFPPDPAKGIELLQRLAEEGDAEGQYMLSSTFEDQKEQITWLTKSVDQGYAHAQHDLARMYERGNGVARDHEKAIELYTKSAEQGDTHAQLALAEIYEHGRGVEPDPEKSIQWYIAAAEHNYCFQAMRKIPEERRTERHKQLLADFDRRMADEYWTRPEVMAARDAWNAKVMAARDAWNAKFFRSQT